MATVFDTAKYILHRQGSMSTWKLQKLCYYAQAWQYTWTEHPLFNERIEAWRNGPVCPQLFHEHQGRYIVDENDIHGNIDALSEDERDSIDTVLREYGNMEPYDIKELTHLERPWKDARGDLPDNANGNNEITLESMGEYYGSL